MIITILSILLFSIFTVLSAFHFYWLFGGNWGLDSVFPTKDNESGTIELPRFATLIVALGLMSFAMLYLIKSGLLQFPIPNWINSFGYWFIPIIFIFRAVGEFNYLGFFKKVKHTKFAKADSKIFAPLCLTIGIIGIIIQLLH